MMRMRDEISNFRSVVNKIRSSMKRGDIYEDLRNEMHVKQELSPLDVENRLSSTFTMVKKMYLCQSVINENINRILELSEI